MEALSTLELLFFAVVIVLSYAIRGSAGFGGVTVPLLALIACAAALPLMAIGAFLGKPIHANLNQLKFQRRVAVLLLASGVRLVLR